MLEENLRPPAHFTIHCTGKSSMPFSIVFHKFVPVASNLNNIGFDAVT